MVFPDFSGVIHHITSKEDRDREKFQLTVLPCVEYEVEVYADLKNGESAEAAIVKFTAKEQPELTADAASNIHIMYGSISVSRKRDITDVTSGVVKGDFDQVLVDKECKSVQKAFVLFKT